MQDEIPGFLTNLTAAYQLRYHIGLATKRKQLLFEAPAARELVTATLGEVCRRYGYHLLDHAVAANGLHLLLSLKPEHSVSAAVRAIKGNVWAAMRDAGRPQVVWSRGIFVRSVGSVAAPQIVAYVASQFEHHGHEATARWVPAGCQADLSQLSALRRSAHAVFELNYHFVFVVARRESLFDGDTIHGVLECLRQSADRQGLPVWGMEVVPDHAHLFVGLEPSSVPAGSGESLHGRHVAVAGRASQRRAAVREAGGRVEAELLCRHGWRGDDGAGEGIVAALGCRVNRRVPRREAGGIGGWRSL